MTVQVLEGWDLEREPFSWRGSPFLNQKSERGRPVLEPVCETRVAPDGRAEGLPGGRVGAQGWGLPLLPARVVRGQWGGGVAHSLPTSRAQSRLRPWMQMSLFLGTPSRC